jgi:hypothetical protein
MDLSAPPPDHAPHRPADGASVATTFAFLRWALREAVDAPSPETGQLLTTLALYGAAWAEWSEPLRLTLIGPTGAGKTRLATALATALAAPFVVVALTDLAETNWRGPQLADVLDALHPTALPWARDEHNQKPGDLPICDWRSVVVLDELDKLALRTAWGTMEDGSAAWRLGRQQSLLPLLDPLGHVLITPRDDRPTGVLGWSLRRSLVISCGAFSDVIAPDAADPCALVAAGLMPELVDRLGAVVTVPSISLVARTAVVRRITPRAVDLARAFGVAPAHVEPVIEAAQLERCAGPRGLAHFGWHVAMTQLATALHETLP